jgi:PadR family transcriptional regulator AphA
LQLSTFLRIHSLLNFAPFNDQRFLEAVPGKRFISSVSDITTILEACFDNQAHRILFYSENLGNEFYDLNSGMVGEMLQKFRNYGIRIAVVQSQDLPLSSRFGEVMKEENQGSYFRLFEKRDIAQEWLCAD